jgi:hypothetical protein
VEEDQDEREREEYKPPHRHSVLNPQTVLVRVFVMEFVRDLVGQRWRYFVIVGEGGMTVLEHRYLHRHHPVIRFLVLFRQRRFYDLLF